MHFPSLLRAGQACAAGQRPEAAVTISATGLASSLELRQLEAADGWTSYERLRVLWYRLLLTVQEMNYATRRMAVLQARLPRPECSPPSPPRR